MLTYERNATNPRQGDHHKWDTWPAIMKVCFLVEEAIWKAASLRNLIACVSENRQDRISNPRPEGDQTSGKRGSPALQVDPPLKIIRQDKWTHLWTILPLNSGQDNKESPRNSGFGWILFTIIWAISEQWSWKMSWTPFFLLLFYRSD